MQEEWQAQRGSFEVIDVRELKNNFLPMLLKKAKETPVGEGICVIRSFEPVPLYSALADLGFDHLTEKVADSEYRVYFYRFRKKEPTMPMGDVPLKPTAMVNFKEINEELADIIVHFWEFTWDREKPAIDRKTKYLLSFANGVGAGRYRQATRELVKAYAADASVAELDELFSMFVWNQGVGTFASEIGPSPLFGAYRLIKTLEAKGKSREEVLRELLERFGEKNPDVSTFYRGRR